MREYVVTCCSTADMSRTFMETNEVPFAMFHYQLDGKEYADDLGQSMPFDVFYKARLCLAEALGVFLPRLRLNQSNGLSV